MPYALLQKTLDIPPVEKLKAAFRSSRILTETDAHILANDAFGILVKGQTPENARRLQGALSAEGVETEIVEERLLPQMPPTKFVTRIDCKPEAIVIYDPLGRSFPLEWQHIMLVAAGNVKLQDFKRVTTTRTVPTFSHTSTNYRMNYETIIDTEFKEESNSHPLLEIVLDRAALRYTIQVDKPLVFQYLGERRTTSDSKNFTLLVQDICRFAPHIAVNRGAYYLRENSTEPFAYPSKNAFYEEITWLLWNMNRSQETRT